MLKMGALVRKKYSRLGRDHEKHAPPWWVLHRIVAPATATARLSGRCMCRNPDSGREGTRHRAAPKWRKAPNWGVPGVLSCTVMGRQNRLCPKIGPPLRMPASGLGATSMPLASIDLAIAGAAPAWRATPPPRTAVRIHCYRRPAHLKAGNRRVNSPQRRLTEGFAAFFVALVPLGIAQCVKRRLDCADR